MCLKVYNYCPACMGPTSIYQYHVCNKAGTCPGILKEKRPIAPELISGSHYHCLNYGCGMSEKVMTTHEERINAIIKSMNEETGAVPCPASALASSGPTTATSSPIPALVSTSSPAPAPALAPVPATTAATATTTKALSPVAHGTARLMGAAPTDNEIEELLAAPRGSPKKKMRSPKKQQQPAAPAAPAPAGQGQIEAAQPSYAPPAARSPPSLSRPMKRASPGSAGRPAKRQQTAAAGTPSLPPVKRQQTAAAGAPSRPPATEPAVPAAPVITATPASTAAPATAAPAPSSGGEEAAAPQGAPLFSDEELEQFFGGTDLLSAWAQGQANDGLVNQMMGFDVRGWGTE